MLEFRTREFGTNDFFILRQKLREEKSRAWPHTRESWFSPVNTLALEGGSSKGVGAMAGMLEVGQVLSEMAVS